MVSSRPGAFKVDSLPQHRPPQRAAVRIGVVEENPIEVQQTGLGNQFRSQPPNGCRRREPMAGPLQLLDDVPAVHEQRRPPHECLLLHPGRAECASRSQPGGRRRRTASHSGLSASEPKPGNAVRRISLRVPFLFARLTPGRVRATRPFFGWVTLTRRRVRLSRSEYRSGGCAAQSEPGAGPHPTPPPTSHHGRLRSRAPPGKSLDSESAAASWPASRRAIVMRGGPMRVSSRRG